MDEKKEILKIEREIEQLKGKGDNVKAAELMRDLADLYKKTGEIEKAQQIYDVQNDLIIKNLKDLLGYYRKEVPPIPLDDFDPLGDFNEEKSEEIRKQQEILRTAEQNAIKIKKHLKKVKGIRNHFEEEAEYIATKFSSLMKERDTNILHIDKIYLMEIIDKIYLQPNRMELRSHIFPYLKQKGFTIEDKGDKLKISYHKLEYKIENVVASVSIESIKNIDLNQIAHMYTDAEYNPERFPGLVMRIENPRATILIFSTGKMVVTGLREVKDAEVVVDKVVKNLKEVGVNLTIQKIIIENIGATGDFHTKIDLNKAIIFLKDATYEPEVFPGLIYRMQDPKAVFLIFSTGRFVCTGAKSEDEAIEAIEKRNLEINI